VPILAPLISKNVSHQAFEREGNLHLLFRVASLKTLDGGGIQAMVTVPNSWGSRESTLEELLAYGGLFSMGALTLAIAG
jgi:hypothetical protein